MHEFYLESIGNVRHLNSVEVTCPHCNYTEYNAYGKYLVECVCERTYKVNEPRDRSLQ